MTQNLKFCLECGERIYGRTDKKFCGDYCRTHYHNKNNSLFHQQMRHINRVLVHNRNILEELLEARNACILGSQRLAEAGFRFDYFTQTRRNAKGAINFMVYDVGYTYTQGEKIKIFRNSQE